MAQAGAILGIDRCSIPRLIRQGVIRSVEFNGRPRITRAELDRLLTEGFDGREQHEPPTRKRRHRPKVQPGTFGGVMDIAYTGSK